MKGVRNILMRFSATEKDPPSDRQQRGSIDFYFLALVLLMLLFGTAMSYSASAVYGAQFYGDSLYFFKRYVLFAILSVAVTVPFVLCTTPDFWRGFGVVLYAGALSLLILVLLIGTVGGGAQRWLVIGPLTIQPSELAKLALVLMLALVMTKYEDKITSTKPHGGSFLYGVLLPGALMGAICLLVAAEKHISGLLIIGMIGVGVMFLGGTRLKYLGIMAAAVGAAGVLLVLVSSYAQVRVNTWLHIEEVDPLGAAWQTLQGLYAIGSGGLFGKGFGAGLQKHGYVSQPQNDFIFTVICEELGFLGALAVIVLFLLLVLRGFYIASHAPDKFSSLAVFGISLKLALQAALNIAVVTNSMPNTGVSLPFFSSGGTFLAIQIFEMGIVLSISRYSTGRKK
ncbi:MAG: FtsW/RodA/SpoVE family cell cycle protein [Clostridia bacterium]|nr:FtsW/RodA/SpoVE family cell cycle protein [Clostridia bacterium]